MLENKNSARCKKTRYTLSEDDCLFTKEALFDPLDLEKCYTAYCLRMIEKGIEGSTEGLFTFLREQCKPD